MNVRCLCVTDAGMKEKTHQICLELATLHTELLEHIIPHQQKPSRVQGKKKWSPSQKNLLLKTRVLENLSLRMFLTR